MSSSTRKRSLSPDSNSEGRQIRRRLDVPEDILANVESIKFDYPSLSQAFKVVTPVQLQQPSSLLTFSYSSSRELEFTNSALRYYVHPPKGADLRYGYERWVRRPEERGRIDNLLRAVYKVCSRMDSAGVDGQAWLRSVGVVSWRGVMTKILTAPYEERDSWELNVMMRDGTLYFEEHLNEDRLLEKNNIAPHHRLQMYYGYAFESYCTSPSPAGMTTVASTGSGWGGDVDTNIQWCSVVKTKLGDTRLVIGGEVDCVRGQFTGKTDSFVELKTSLTIRGPQDEARFEKKLLKFYFQSFLLGVPEITVGFRTPSGQLTRVQSFKTMEIPRLVRDKPSAWDPLICLDWGKRFIDMLKSTVATYPSLMSEALPVWRVKFTPRSGVTVTLLDETGVDEVANGEDRVGFLPKWYLDELDGSKRQSSDRSKPAVSAVPLEASRVNLGAKLLQQSGWKI